MNNEEIKKRVQEIDESIKSLQDEFSKIKSECAHDNYHVGFYSWRAGSLGVAKICDYCSYNMGTPNEKEVEKFLEEKR